MDTKQIRHKIKVEFQSFEIPDGFCGGRFQSHEDYVYVHIRPDGTIGKIEICKPGGTIFYIKP